MDERVLQVPAPLGSLRGLGPRVFISYSFGDRELAGVIANNLRQCGMQVRMENELSLLGSKLDDMLPERIRNCEVFVQVVTETSAQSMWVAREFEWATSSGDGPVVVLPVVVEGVAVPEPVASWAYLPVTTPIDGISLDRIREVAMRSLVVLPLDPHRPYQLAWRELTEYCASGTAGKLRVLLDPEGLVIRLTRATVEYGVGLNADYREQLITQQHEQYNWLLRYLTALDPLLSGVMQRILPIAASYWSSEECSWEVAQVVQRFVKMTIGPIVLDLVAHWSIAIEDELQSAAIDKCKSAITNVSILREMHKTPQQKADILWALDATPGQEWLNLDFDGVDVRGVHAFLPADRFGEMGASFLMAGFSPAAEVTTVDWLTICVPQVAAHIIPAKASSVPDVLDSVGWSVSDYRYIGLH